MTRNSASKFIFSLILTTALIFSAAQSVFGVRGFLANRYLSREIEALKDQLTVSGNEIGRLESTASQLKSPEYITRVMNRIGYVQEGQSIYIMERTTESNRSSQTASHTETENPMMTLSVAQNLLVSFALALLINVPICLIKRKKRGNDHERYHN